MTKGPTRIPGKHTPGPWVTGNARWDANGDAMYTLHGIKEVCAPDARLIAAAPEMLAALKVVATIRNGWPEVFDQVDAAITKAEGETK